VDNNDELRSLDAVANRQLNLTETPVTTRKNSHFNHHSTITTARSTCITQTVMSISQTEIQNLYRTGFKSFTQTLNRHFSSNRKSTVEMLP